MLSLRVKPFCAISLSSFRRTNTEKPHSFTPSLAKRRDGPQTLGGTRRSREPAHPSSPPPPALLSQAASEPSMLLRTHRLLLFTRLRRRLLLHRILILGETPSKSHSTAVGNCYDKVRLLSHSWLRKFAGRGALPKHAYDQGGATLGRGTRDK